MTRFDLESFFKANGYTILEDKTKISFITPNRSACAFMLDLKKNTLIDVLSAKEYPIMAITSPDLGVSLVYQEKVF